MSQKHFISIPALSGNWLTAAALWAVIGAWGSLGAWGWLQCTQGFAAIILVALAIGAQIISARMLVHAGAAANVQQAIVCLVLGLGCMAFAGLSGKRGLDQVETQRLAAYEVARANHEAAKAALGAVEAQFPPPLQLSLAVPAERVERLQAVRAAELERLRPQHLRVQAALEAAPAPTAPLDPMPDWISWAVVALIEALEFCGFWAIGAAHRPRTASTAHTIPFDPSEAARRLVGMRKDRKAA